MRYLVLLTRLNVQKAVTDSVVVAESVDVQVQAAHDQEAVAQAVFDQ